MGYEIYSCVRLTTDRYRHEGVGRGDIGAIIEVYDDGSYEVEFSNDDGVTILLIVLGAHEIEIADDA